MTAKKFNHLILSTLADYKSDESCSNFICALVNGSSRGEIEQLDDYIRNALFSIIDTFVRDFKTRKAYA